MDRGGRCEKTGNSGQGIGTDAEGGGASKERATLLLETLEGGLRGYIGWSGGGVQTFRAAHKHC